MKRQTKSLQKLEMKWNEGAILEQNMELLYALTEYPIAINSISGLSRQAFGSFSATKETVADWMVTIMQQMSVCISTAG